MRPSHSFRPLLLSFSALLACTALNWPATARGVADPANSEVPPCLAACPGGDLVTVIVVRDFNNVPMENSTVLIDFSHCPAFVICPPEKSDPYIYDEPSRTVRALTDATGAVGFPLRTGGVCGMANGVLVWADGVLLANRTLASADQDGNLSVSATDQAIANAKLGAPDPTADFDCNGTVTAADLGVVQSHLMHYCAGATPGRPRSWGSIKVIYR